MGAEACRADWAWPTEPAIGHVLADELPSGAHAGHEVGGVEDGVRIGHPLGLRLCLQGRALVGPRQRRDAVGHPILVDRRCVLCSEAVAFSACCCHEDQEPDDSGQQTAQRARQQHPVLSLAIPAMTADPFERSPDRHETVPAVRVDDTSCPKSGQRRPRRVRSAAVAEEGRRQGRRRTRAPGAMAVEGGGPPCPGGACDGGGGGAAAPAGRQAARPEGVRGLAVALWSSSSASAGLGGAAGGGAERRRAWRWRDGAAAGAPRGRCRPAERTRSRHWWTGRRRRGPVPAAPAASAPDGDRNGGDRRRRRGVVGGAVTGGKTQRERTDRR